MNRKKLWIGLMLAGLLAPSAAQAQLFWKRTPATPSLPPAQQVTNLIKQLKEDGDENKRLAAIEELRGMDATAHPEMIGPLMEALFNDKKPSVRAEAAYTLGRVRPVQSGIGQALEYARDNDASMRVRLQARGTLLGYYIGGYRSGQEESPSPLTPGASSKNEPPLATGPNVSSPGSGSALPFSSPPVTGIATTPSSRLTPIQTGPVTAEPKVFPNLQTAPPPTMAEPPVYKSYQPLPVGPIGSPAPIGTAPQGPSLVPPG